MSDKPQKPKPISKKIRAAINLMVDGDVKTVTDAAVRAGLTREHLSRELSRPHIAHFYKGKVERRLAMASARAGDTKISLLDSPNEMVKDRASTFILALAGISPEAASAAPRSGAMPGLAIVVQMGDGTARPYNALLPKRPVVMEDQVAAPQLLQIEAASEQ